MKAVLFDAGSADTCHPVTCTRPLEACPIGNRPLGDIQRERLLAAGFELFETGADKDLFVRHDAWLSDAMLQQLTRLPPSSAIRDPHGVILAWIGDSAQAVLSATAIMADQASFLIRYPWDLLAIHEQVLAAVAGPRISGDVDPGATVSGTLVLGKGSRLLPGVYVEGTVVIGENCKVGPNCYIRGSTSIGDNCHIGQAVEIKNSIIMEGASIGHLSYCGDSIIGRKVNFGAGTITANFRHDGKTHRSLVEGALVDTGRRKFGAVVGDHVHTGIHTSIYPGRKLWPHASTLPGEIVKTDMPG